MQTTNDSRLMELIYELQADPDIVYVLKVMANKHKETDQNIKLLADAARELSQAIKTLANIYK